ncbi:rRNA methyltransferase 2 [Trichoderma ghanense]|uniref:rRNA methyltransferase 2, mitochondrial n=1 Tax=Trichoderma ghanense TaxID=65468 RepID=A0ABY2GQX1_9HYPO
MRSQTVVDLTQAVIWSPSLLDLTLFYQGYAPGSWSQVAVDRTRPYGRVIGIDLIPAHPPQGVATFQGDFLSPSVQKLVKDFIAQSHSDRPLQANKKDDVNEDEDLSSEHTVIDQPSYIDRERHSAGNVGSRSGSTPTNSDSKQSVDVVLSDMSEPWDQESGFSSTTLSNPYDRLMNTSGNRSRDHAGSMDLCEAALQFASDTLKPGGHFVCKFYTGSEDKELEKKLKLLFSKVYREKPDASRAESKEAYFVALFRKAKATVDSTATDSHDHLE